MRALRIGIAAFVLVVVAPAAVFAQASITGVVRDSSGAVLPGVTVEAASPALLEKVRVATTDNTGQYRITELRPGPVLFRRGGEEIDLALSGGFMEVRDDNVVVLADTAERSDEIDQARAEEARRKAQEEIAERQGTIDLARAMAALERAQARLRVVDRRRRRPGGAPRPTAQD